MLLWNIKWALLILDLIVTNPTIIKDASTHAGQLSDAEKIIITNTYCHTDKTIRAQLIYITSEIVCLYKWYLACLIYID